MSVRIEPQGDAAVITAGRRLVVGNREVLKDAVVAELENGRQTVVVDFGETDLIDSGGLGALVSLHRLAGELGGNLLLANLCEDLVALLRLTRLDTIFTVAEGVDEALREGRNGAGPPAEEVPPPAAPA